MPQSLQALGVELIAINLFGMQFPLSNLYKFCLISRDSRKRDDWAIMRAVRYILAFLIGVAGGVVLIRQSLWGMYMLTASFVALLILVALNASSIMFTND
jgi:hypothetical protein